MTRRQAREAAFALLFQVFEGECSAGEALADWCAGEGAGKDSAFVGRLLNGTVDHLESLDAIIREHLVNWDFQRLLSADKHLLRLALYEMLHEGTPPPVVINEAVEIAKKFGNDESPGFINGLLGRVTREREVAG